MTITWNTFADHFGGGAAMVFINLQDFLARVPRVNLRMLLQPVQPCKNVQAGSSRFNPPPVLSISRERLQKLQVVDCWLMVLENATPARGGLQQSWQPVWYPLLNLCVSVNKKLCTPFWSAKPLRYENDYDGDEREDYFSSDARREEITPIDGSCNSWKWLSATDWCAANKLTQIVGDNNRINLVLRVFEFIRE